MSHCNLMMVPDQNTYGRSGTSSFTRCGLPAQHSHSDFELSISPNEPEKAAILVWSAASCEITTDSPGSRGQSSPSPCICHSVTP